MRTPRAKILVVEDDPAILGGVLDVLVFNGFEAQGEEDGERGLEQALAGGFDLVLLDVMLPGMDGFSVCKQLRAKRPAQPIVMLTAKGAESDVLTGFKCGADDYVSKPFSIRELLARIEAVLRRSGKAVDQMPLRFREMTFDPTTLKARTTDQELDITRREMDILAYLCANRERIVTKKELLTQVWHYADADIETRTVDIHIQKLRKKISQLLGEVPVILTVRGEGYRLAPESGAGVNDGEDACAD
jgi:DNA-binding response OmpR family regulator